MICLSTHYNCYNLCGSCNNFIICTHCYNDKNIHKINNCIHCRHKLSKTFNYSFDTLHIIIKYYKYAIIHILFNIIYSNIFLYIYFPRNLEISNMFSTTITHLFLVNNISNFILIPIIYNNFTYYDNMSIIYSCVNILYSLLFYTVSNPKSQLQIYYIYYTTYFYILTLSTLCVFTLYHIILTFNISRIILYTNNNMYLIKIHNNVVNSLTTSTV